MVWCWTGTKPLSKLMIIKFPNVHTLGTRVKVVGKPQAVEILGVCLSVTAWKSVQHAAQCMNAALHNICILAKHVMHDSQLINENNSVYAVEKQSLSNMGTFVKFGLCMQFFIVLSKWSKFNSTWTLHTVYNYFLLYKQDAISKLLHLLRKFEVEIFTVESSPNMVQYSMDKIIAMSHKTQCIGLWGIDNITSMG